MQAGSKQLRCTYCTPYLYIRETINFKSPPRQRQNITNDDRCRRNMQHSKAYCTLPFPFGLFPGVQSVHLRQIRTLVDCNAIWPGGRMFSVLPAVLQKPGGMTCRLQLNSLQTARAGQCQRECACLHGTVRTPYLVPRSRPGKQYSRRLDRCPAAANVAAGLLSGLKKALGQV